MKKFRSPLCALFYAAYLSLCASGTCLAQPSAPSELSQNPAGTTETITAQDGKVIPFKNLKINDVYTNAPSTPSYGDEEVIIISVSTVMSSEDKSENGDTLYYQTFYHNTKTGDPHFYQINTSRLNHSGPDFKDVSLRGLTKKDLPLIEKKGQIAKWTQYLASGKGKMFFLPDIPIVEYAFQTKDERLVIVTSKLFNNTGGKENYQLYIGTPGKMERFDINLFMRLRDGGTTNIEAKGGNNGDKVELLIPAPQDDELATLNGKTLEKRKDLLRQDPQAWLPLQIPCLGKRFQTKTPN